jgi:hypothetical protein
VYGGHISVAECLLSAGSSPNTTEHEKVRSTRSPAHGTIVEILFLSDCGHKLFRFRGLHNHRVPEVGKQTFFKSPQIRKFLGSFHYRESANFLGMPVCKFLQNGAQLYVKSV